MSCLTLINGSIRKLPILLRILVIGAISTALTYVLGWVLTGIFGFVYALVTNYTLWCVIPTAILIGICTGKGGKNGGGLQRSVSGIASVIGAFVVLWAISGIMKAMMGSWDEGPHLRNFHGCRLDRRALRRYRETRWI